MECTLYTTDIGEGCGDVFSGVELGAGVGGGESGKNKDWLEPIKMKLKTKKMQNVKI